MKAVAYRQSLPVTDPHALLDITLPQPSAQGHDILVRVEAIAVNPVDYKVRQNMPPQTGDYRVLGWDAAGEVVAAGENVTEFTPGDKVYYAGDLTRPGSNAEYQLADARLAGHKPKSLSSAEAAALPLTTITAWEMLFDHLQLNRRSTAGKNSPPARLLVTGAAGGVGSILIQLARRLSNATIIATASRPQSRDWVTSIGAHHTIDHSKDLPSQLKAIGIGQVSHVASLNGTEQHFDALTEVLAPFGTIAMIDDPAALDISKLKLKSLSLHWEFMFTRSMYQTTDLGRQGDLLSKVAQLVDDGLIKTTMGQHLGIINAENLRRAHGMLEAGNTIGKIVLEGFSA